MPTLTFDVEHVDAVRAAITALQARQQLLLHYGRSSVELALQIDDLEELVDRMDAAVAGSPVLRVVRPW